ncbi:MAG: DUF2344 domain-containing protein [Clostridia bacterium]|nr:DUF2344 domain-containing protein [Clostridia bacterium]
MVPQNEARQVRIRFTKTGSLMYISHLDLSRTMQRIMVRAGIDIWYSEGFNPQPRIVFAVPLPVGVESECELMDIKINSFMEFDEIKRRLNYNFPTEMRVTEVYEPVEKPKNVVYILHEIKIHSEKITENTATELEGLFSNDVFVTKKAKGSEKEINIKEFISSLKVDYDGEDIVINAVLCAGNDKSLNPELLVEAIRKNTDIFDTDLISSFYSIKRLKMLRADLSEFR